MCKTPQDHLLEQNKLKGAVQGTCENRSVHGSACGLKGCPKKDGGLIVPNIYTFNIFQPYLGPPMTHIFGIA